MKMLLPLICLLSMALAEPPVGDSYASAHSSHDHDHTSDFQRSLYQEYGPPSARSFSSSQNSLSTEYGPPNARTASPSLRNSQTYLPPSSRGISQEYGAPNARSQTANSRGLSTEYGVPNARSQSASSRGLSTEYGVPNARSQSASSRGISTEYSVPNARSQTVNTRGLSTEYGVPNARIQSSSRGLSTEYGVPNSRTAPSQEYGAPLSEEYSVPSSKSSDSYTRSPSTQYGTPEFRTPSEEYGAPLRGFGAKSPSQKYGAPQNSQTLGNSLSEHSIVSARNLDSGRSTPRSFAKSFSSSSRSFNAQTPRSNYKAAARSSDSYSQDFKGYSAAQRDLSDTYGVPSAKGLSQEYGVPNRDEKTNAIASSYSSANARSSPSESYGVPSARDSMPSDQYGVPDQYNSISNQGYSYARDALNELLNQEPANYDFSYKVNDYESGSDFGHTESRQDNRAEGTYFVVLPDGTKQVVEYEADERGFKPRISLEPVDLARSGGYDDNAADLSRSGDGPY